MVSVVCEETAGPVPAGLTRSKDPAGNAERSLAISAFFFFVFFLRFFALLPVVELHYWIKVVSLVSFIWLVPHFVLYSLSLIQWLKFNAEIKITLGCLLQQQFVEFRPPTLRSIEAVIPSPEARPSWCWQCAGFKPGLKGKCWEPQEALTHQWLQGFYLSKGKLCMKRKRENFICPI